MINRNSILSEIPTLANQVSQLVQQKTINLPFKVSHAIAKNVAKSREVETKLYEFKTELEKKYCEFEPDTTVNHKVVKGKSKVTPTKDAQGRDAYELVFKSEEAKQKFAEESNDYLNEEIKFDAYKIKMKDIENVANLTPSVLATMDKYGMIEP